ncbi:MAG: VCBS repeat-containing protein [Planctomycetota bacterium]
MRRTRIAAGLAGVVAASGAAAQVRFADATARLGLDGIEAQHAAFADLDADGFDDLIVQRTRVFLNRPAGGGARRFVEVERSGLPERRRGDITVFADVDNDGMADAIVSRYLDVNNPDFEPPPAGTPRGLAWLRGNGDGTFGDPVGAFTPIDAATRATACAIAVADLPPADGRLDLVVGHWYERYGGGLAGFASDVLRQREDGGFERLPWPTDGVAFDGEADAGGRPTYGVLVADLLEDSRSGVVPEILELNYGRRWNRLWRPTEGGAVDVAASVKLDGDAIRHGRYPEWLKERARTDPRFERDDERPFRANGNTFDAAVGDVDNDGDFDVLLTEITHGWAGESSDRSRVLLREDGFAGPLFVAREGLSLDRVPADPAVRSWNQGDIYGALADFDLDGRLDVLLCSSDYPDNQRLRIFAQRNGGLVDVTSWSGIDHIGAGQPSLADFDGDGDLDIVVGQSFNRLPASQRAGRTPRLRIFENRAADGDARRGLVLRLVGAPERGVARDPLGAIVRVTAVVGGERITQSRQLVGIGGHQGKQHAFVVHAALGGAPAERVEILWPGADGLRTTLTNVPAGTHVVRAADASR